MIADAPAMLAVLATVLGAMAVASRLAARPGVPAEAARKLVHLVSGAVALPFPWIFATPGPVVALCVLSLLLVGLVRRVPALRRLLGEGLHGVSRRSLGDVLLPVSIAALFVLTQDRPAFYVVPVAVMALADGTAALVGLRYGLSLYATSEGTKSWEGTIAFFLLAAIGTLVPLLLLTDIGRAEVLLLALLVGVVGCTIEASSWYGLDNLLVPFGTYLLLRRHEDLPAADLLWEVAVIALVAMVIVLWSRRVMLDTQARFSALLAGYFFWVVGGPAWLTPGVAVFVLNSLIVPVPAAARRPVQLWAVLSPAAAGLPWVAMARGGLLDFADAYLGFCMTFATQLGFACVMRHRLTERSPVAFREALEWSFLAAGGLSVAFFLQVPAQQTAMVLVGTGMLGTLGAILLWARLDLGDPDERAWAGEVAVSLAVGFFCLIALHIAGAMP